MTDLDDAAVSVGEISETEIAHRLELIGALSLAQRASGFLQLHGELLTELERSDQQPLANHEVGDEHA